MDVRQNTHPRPIPSRRRMLATTAALAPVLTGAGTVAGTGTAHAAGHDLVQPVLTGLADWTDVGRALGGPGDMKRYMYHTGMPRRDLTVYSHGVRIEPALALGTHVSFVRYADGSSLLMGDAVVTERELQPFGDTLAAHGIQQTAIHKHLLAQRPDIWWVHVHAHGHDPVAVAQGLRAAFDRTATPPPTPAGAASTLPDLDTAAIDAALGVKGVADTGIWKNTFVRAETITDGHMVLPPGLGSTTSVNFQPLGQGLAAINGDLVMVAGEVHNALVALRRAGIDLVELHHHNLTDDPRLFFVHYWAVGDAVRLARGLRPAVESTNVVPLAGVSAG